MQRRRRLVLWGGSGLGVLLVLWVLANQTAWAGPIFASSLRRMIGADRVAALEDTAYSIQDKFNRWRRVQEAPTSPWKVKNGADGSAAAIAPAVLAYRPADVGPMLKGFSADGDGIWVPAAVPGDTSGAVFKTLLHPDKDRPWTEVFVYALDVTQFSLHLVAGFQEPRAETADARERYRDGTAARPAIIPAADRDRLVAAFNGGFMAEHGHWGMRVDNVTLLEPKSYGCTVARLDDGTLRIRTFSALGDDAKRMVWYRQTPPCMLEAGKMHPKLDNPDAKAWGATLSGATIIRRSALGLDAAGRTLYVALGNSTNARALALAMQHAGAVDVAQLDVNWSYPKILFYKKNEAGALVAEPGAPGFTFQPGEYVDQKSNRDFFYLTRR